MKRRVAEYSVIEPLLISKIKKKFIALVFSVPFAILILQRIFSPYTYDVEQNYQYSFKNTGASLTDIYFKDGKIHLPKQNKRNQTLFLKINIKTTFFGNFFQPYINAHSGDLSVTQYFEYSAKGVRYINISSLISSQKEIDILFDEKYVSIDDQSAKLVTFNNYDINDKKILILAPHPDDAEIAAYGLYSDHTKSYIITVTAGDAGEYKYDEIYDNEADHYLKKGQLRTWNSITVPLLGGIPPEQSINLGFFDSTLKRMFQDKSKIIPAIFTKISNISTYRKINVSSLSNGLSGVSNWESLVNNLRYLLAEIHPSIIIAPYPALDSHPDHKFSSLALFEAIKKSNFRDGYLYLYSNHLSLNEYFPYGKEGGAISLPPNFDRTLYFDSIYSYALDSCKQKDKIFALDAMNDLRLDTEWRFVTGNIKNFIKISVRKILNRENDYYRRSVRSNELFFVVNIDNIYNENILYKIIGDISCEYKY